MSKKRFLIIVLSCVIVLLFGNFGLLNVANACDIIVENGVRYQPHENGNYMVVGLCDNIEKISIPGTINGKTVDRIHKINSDSLKEIDMPDTVMDISENAFSGCRMLDKVILPKHLAELKKDVFARCYRLRKIVLPDSLKSIKDGAFCLCKELETICMPSSVDNIDENAFKYCHILSNILVDPENKNYKTDGSGSLYDLRLGKKIIEVDKEDLAEKSKKADEIYNGFKNMTNGVNSLDEYKKKANEFMQNYGVAKPKLVSKADFDKECKNKKALYRGIVGKKYGDALKYNEKFSYFCNGFSGDAIYTTSDREYAERYTYGKKDSCIVEMTYSDDAKITNHLEMEIIKDLIVAKHYDEFVASEMMPFGDIEDSINKSFITNYGLMAAMLGFDAIDDSCVSDENGEFFWIGNEFPVVNRSKLIICDEKCN